MFKLLLISSIIATTLASSAAKVIGPTPPKDGITLKSILKETLHNNTNFYGGAQTTCQWTKMRNMKFNVANTGRYTANSHNHCILGCASMKNCKAVAYESLIGNCHLVDTVSYWYME